MPSSAASLYMYKKSKYFRVNVLKKEKIISNITVPP